MLSWDCLLFYDFNIFTNITHIKRLLHNRLFNFWNFSHTIVYWLHSNLIGLSSYQTRSSNTVYCICFNLGRKNILIRWGIIKCTIGTYNTFTRICISYFFWWCLIYIRLSLDFKSTINIRKLFFYFCIIQSFFFYRFNIN